MANTKNMDWQIAVNLDHSVSIENARLAVLMDIRDELQKLNRLLHCHNAVRIPKILDAIRRNTTKRRKKK